MSFRNDITKIGSISKLMSNVTIEGNIVNFNGFMIVVDDESGRTFVRYRKYLKSNDKWHESLNQIKIGNLVRIENCEPVCYHGIIQLKMNKKSHISSVKQKTSLNKKLKKTSVKSLLPMRSVA